MTIQRGRSKDRVVRLEPFFRNVPVAGCRGVPHAARAAAMADSNRTETRFETPDSSIVTP
jgi:hypothetical protein